MNCVPRIKSSLYIHYGKIPWNHLNKLGHLKTNSISSYISHYIYMERERDAHLMTNENYINYICTIPKTNSKVMDKLLSTWVEKHMGVVEGTSFPIGWAPALVIVYRTMMQILWRDWEPVSIAFQALSLVEKADPVQVASHHAWGINGVRPMPHESQRKFHNLLQHGTLLLKSLLILVSLLQLWNSKH